MSLGCMGVGQPRFLHLLPKAIFLRWFVGHPLSPKWLTLFSQTWRKKHLEKGLCFPPGPHLLSVLPQRDFPPETPLGALSGCRALLQVAGPTVVRL